MRSVIMAAVVFLVFAGLVHAHDVGTLVIDTTGGVKIFIDGDLRGLTDDDPLVMHLPPGEYVLKAHKPGHQDLELEVILQALETTFVRLQLFEALDSDDSVWNEVFRRSIRLPPEFEHYIVEVNGRTLADIAQPQHLFGPIQVFRLRDSATYLPFIQVADARSMSTIELSPPVAKGLEIVASLPVGCVDQPFSLQAKLLYETGERIGVPAVWSSEQGELSARFGTEVTFVSSRGGRIAVNASFAGLHSRRALAIAYSVSGRILDGNGQGVPGVSMLVTDGPRDADLVVTDSQGNWRFDDMVDPLQVHPFRSGYTFEPAHLLLADATDEAVFSASYRIAGQVLDGNGDGVAGVTISFSQGEPVQSNQSGFWQQAGFSGPVQISVCKRGYSFRPDTRQLFEPMDDLVFIGSYSASGSITDGFGQGVSGVLVKVGDRLIFTQDDGTWSIDGLSGRVETIPQHGSFLPQKQVLTTSTETADFVMAFTASGRIVDSMGRGVAGVTVSLGDRAVVTDLDGYWQKPNVTGSILVVPQGAGYRFEPAQIAVQDGAQVANFTATYTAQGHVVDSLGRGIANVAIAISGQPSIQTDRNGRWSAAKLSGPVTITPSIDGHTIEPQTFQVNGPMDRIIFVAGYEASGRVTDVQGRGIEGVTVEFTGGYPSQRTDGNGNWRAPGLSGAVRVTVSQDGLVFVPESTSISRESGGVDFSESYTVSGRLTDVRGQAIGGARIEFSHGHGHTISADDGRWTKSGLTGAVTVTPSLSGYAFRPAANTVDGFTDAVNFDGSYSVRVVITDAIDANNTVRLSGGFGEVTLEQHGGTISGLGGTVRLTPTNFFHVYSPRNLSVSGPGTVYFEVRPSGISALVGIGLALLLSYLVTWAVGEL